MNFALLMSLLVTSCLATGAWFASGTLQRAHLGAVESRFAITLARIASHAEHAAALGIDLSAQDMLAHTLADERRLDPDIDWISITDPGSQVLFGQRGAQADDANRILTHAIRDDLGLMIGQIRLAYDGQVTARPAQLIHDAMLRLTGALMAAAVLAICALIMLGGGYAQRRARSHALLPQSRRWMRLGLSAGVLLILLIGFASIGWQARSLVGHQITPAIAAKAESIGHGAQALIGKALDAGIPLESLNGVESYFQDLRRAYPELSGLALRTSERSLYAAGTLEEPRAFAIRHQGQDVAQLLIAVDARQISRQVNGILLDIAFLGIAALLIGSELLAMSSSHHAFKAMPASEPAAHVRPALFAFMLAEELTRPFLPGFTRDLLPASLTAHIDVLVSLPIVIFMAIVALCQLPFSTWSETLGRRHGFMLGAFCAAIGYGASALTGRYEIFLLARALSAIGFALIFISAQGHILDHATRSGRTGSFATFVRTILVAALCAPPIGGFIADHFGASSAFMASALLALLSLLLARARMSPHRSGAPRVRLSRRTIAAAWRTPGLRPLLLGCAVPAKLVLTALCFYMVPVLLMAQGYSNAEIGRVQMIYPLVMVLGVPAFALFADGANRGDRRIQCVVWGGLVVGVGALLAAAAPGLPMIAAFLFLLGLGQALSIAPQSSLVATYAQHGPGPSTAANVLGLFRLTERVGAAAGPALAGVLLGVAGFGPTTALFGLFAAVGALGYQRSLRRLPVTSPAEIHHDDTPA